MRAYKRLPGVLVQPPRLCGSTDGKGDKRVWAFARVLGGTDVCIEWKASDGSESEASAPLADQVIAKQGVTCSARACVDADGVVTQGVAPLALVTGGRMSAVGSTCCCNAGLAVGLCRSCGWANGHGPRGPNGHLEGFSQGTTLGMLAEDRVLTPLGGLELCMVLAVFGFWLPLFVFLY